MFLLVIFLICIFVTLGFGVLAALSDLRTLTIPNQYSVVIIGSFLMAYGALYLGGVSGAVFGSFASHVLAAGIVFVVTLVLFILKIIGAGDSKFATACALWIGAHELPVFLFFMSLVGALLGVAALYIQRKKPFKEQVGGWIGQVQSGVNKVPYGVAITFGMLIAFIYSGYFSSEVMTKFFTELPPVEAS